MTQIEIEVNSCSIILLKPDGSVCLQHRDDIPSIRFANYWSFPGGSCKEGESLIECAYREIFEETGYTVATLTFLESFCFLEDNDSYQVAFFWGTCEAGTQVECREGTAMEFLKQEETGEILFLPELYHIWNHALKAAGIS